MKILDASWTPQINILTIQCDCGLRLAHRADRWKIQCDCGQVAYLDDLRADYVEAGYQEQLDEDREAINFVRGED